MSPLLVLVVAVLATTYSGPIVRFAAAPALAIAFWRLALVLPVTGALAVWDERPDGRRAAADPADPRAGGAPRAALPLMAVAGVLLGLHFWAWIASLRYTSVASSVVLVSLRPIFAWAMAAFWLDEVPGVRERWGILVAVLGATLIGIADARASHGALAGDVLALGGALAVAGYVVIGRRVRRAVGVWSYVSVVYAVAAAALALVALGRGTPLGGFSSRDWGVIGAMAAGPMLVGHTGMNYALKHLSATTVNVAALGEPVGASVIAWLVPAIHEVPSPSVAIGAVLVLAGIALSLGARPGSRDERDGERAPQHAG
jgi:drug/metabolite transporter (DMT)-like permease